LYHYHETLKELERMRYEILHGGAQVDENIGGGKSNLPGDPTGQKAIALVTNRQINELEKIVQAIDFVILALPLEKQKLVQKKYWDRPQTLTWDGIALELNVSRITAMRWRQEIVQAIGHLIGWR
jgi:RinA family phage transcriptional activator